MGLTHKILDGVDVKDLCEVAASIIVLEIDFFHQIHSRFDSRNLIGYKRLTAIPMVAKE